VRQRLSAKWVCDGPAVGESVKWVYEVYTVRYPDDGLGLYVILLEIKLYNYLTSFCKIRLLLKVIF
jgi:hypothetical protein